MNRVTSTLALARSRPPGPTNGFTLIEILIAVAAFAIVLGAINAVFYGALRLRNKAAEAVDRTVPIRQALDIIKRDLANIVPPGNGLAGPLQSHPTTNAAFAGGGPVFYTSTGVIDHTSPFSGVQKVSYLLGDATNQANGKDLFRLVTRNLLALTEETPEQQWLLSGVDQIAFQFHDGSQWVDHWDSASQTNLLPRGIKFQIQLLNTNYQGARLSAEAPLELVVPLMAQAPTNTAAQEGGGQ